MPPCLCQREVHSAAGICYSGNGQAVPSIRPWLPVHCSSISIWIIWTLYQSKSAKEQKQIKAKSLHICSLYRIKTHPVFRIFAVLKVIYFFYIFTTVATKGNPLHWCPITAGACGKNSRESNGFSGQSCECDSKYTTASYLRSHGTFSRWRASLQPPMRTVTFRYI